MVSPLESADASGQQHPRTHLTRLEAEHGGRRFVIERDSAVGYYLYVFEAARCTHDYLQDSIASAREFAAEQFGVSDHAWREITQTI
jgi:hypothetical protein